MIYNPTHELVLLRLESGRTINLYKDYDSWSNHNIQMPWTHLSFQVQLILCVCEQRRLWRVCAYEQIMYTYDNVISTTIWCWCIDVHCLLLLPWCVWFLCFLPLGGMGLFGIPLWVSHFLPILTCFVPSWWDSRTSLFIYDHALFYIC